LSQCSFEKFTKEKSKLHYILKPVDVLYSICKIFDVLRHAGRSFVILSAIFIFTQATDLCFFTGMQMVRPCNDTVLGHFVMGRLVMGCFVMGRFVLWDVW
jgi:hypothetical protein